MISEERIVKHSTNAQLVYVRNYNIYLKLISEEKHAEAYHFKEKNPCNVKIFHDVMSKIVERESFELRSTINDIINKVVAGKKKEQLERIKMQKKLLLFQLEKLERDSMVLSSWKKIEEREVDEEPVAKKQRRN